MTSTAVGSEIELLVLVRILRSRPVSRILWKSMLCPVSVWACRKKKKELSINRKALREGGV